MQLTDLIHQNGVGKRFGSGILVLALTVTVTYAQSNFTTPLKATTITGNVTDQSGAPIPEAMVTLTSTEGLSLQTKTDRDGRFTEETRPGDYILNISAQGFKTLSEPISLATTTNLTKHLVLALGICGPCFTVELPIEIETLSNPLTVTMPLKPLPKVKLHPRYLKNRAQ